MKLEEKIQLLKFFSIVFNTVFLMVGLSIFGCSVWILFDNGSLLSVLTSEELRTVAGGLFVVGLVVVAVSIMGCVASQVENRLLLLLYMVFLVVLVLGQLFTVILLLSSKDKIWNSLSLTVKNMIVHYSNSSEYTGNDYLLDSVQRYGKCCGFAGPADWENNYFILNLTNVITHPCSCFSSPCPALTTAGRFGYGNSSYEQGCEQKIKTWLEENALTIIGMDIIIMLLQVALFVIVVHQYKSFSLRLRTSGQTIDTQGAEPIYSNQAQDNRVYQDDEYCHDNRNLGNQAQEMDYGYQR